MERALGTVSDMWDFVLARVAIDFRQELVQDDDAVLVRVMLERIGTSSLTLHARRFGSSTARSLPRPSRCSSPATAQTGRSRPLTEAERGGADQAALPIPSAS